MERKLIKSLVFGAVVASMSFLTACSTPCCEKKCCQPAPVCCTAAAHGGAVHHHGHRGMKASNDGDQGMKQEHYRKGSKHRRVKMKAAEDTATSEQTNAATTSTDATTNTATPDTANTPSGS